MKEERDLAREQSKPGLEGIWETYTFKGSLNVLWKGYKYPFFLATALTLLIVDVKGADLYDYIGKINGVIILALPALIGFNLAALILFVGFGGVAFLKTIVKYDEKEYSLYQKNAAIFSVTILVQILSILFSLVVQFVWELRIDPEIPCFIAGYNIAVLFILLFLAISSIFVLKDVVVNVWNIARIYHLNLWIEKKREEQKNKPPDQNQAN